MGRPRKELDMPTVVRHQTITGDQRRQLARQQLEETEHLVLRNAGRGCMEEPVPSPLIAEQRREQEQVVMKNQIVDQANQIEPIEEVSELDFDNNELPGHGAQIFQMPNAVTDTRSMEEVLGRAFSDDHVVPRVKANSVDQAPRSEIVAPTLQIDPSTIRGQRSASARLHRLVKTQDKAQKTLIKTANQAAQVAAALGGAVIQHGSTASHPTTAAEVTAERATVALLPPKDKVRLKYRDQLGKIHDIKDYTPQEIELDENLTQFIERRIRPNIGNHDFIIYTLDTAGRESAKPYATIERKIMPNEQRTDANALDMFKVLVETMQSERQQGQTNSNQPLSQIDQMAKLFQALGNNGKTDPAAMIMLPMQMQAMQQAMSAMQGGTPGPNKPTTGMEALLTTLIDRLGRVEDKLKEPPPAPLLPPVVEDRGPNLAELVVTLAAALKPAPAAPPPPPPPDMFATYIMPLLTTFMPVIIQKMTGPNPLEVKLEAMERRLLEKEKEKTDQPASGTIMDRFRELDQVKQMATHLVGNGGSAAPGFAEFMQTLAANIPNTIQVVGDILAAKRGTPPDPRNDPMQLGPGTVATTAQDKAAATVTLELPEELEPLIKQIEEADDTEPIIQAMFNFLHRVGYIKSWQKYIKILHLRAKASDGDGVLKAISGIAQVLVSQRLLSPERGMLIVETFAEHMMEVLAAFHAMYRVQEQEKTAPTTAVGEDKATRLNAVATPDGALITEEQAEQLMAAEDEMDL